MGHYYPRLVAFRNIILNWCSTYYSQEALFRLAPSKTTSCWFYIYIHLSNHMQSILDFSTFYSRFGIIAVVLVYKNKTYLLQQISLNCNPRQIIVIIFTLTIIIMRNCDTPVLWIISLLVLCLLAPYQWRRGCFLGRIGCLMFFRGWCTFQ